MSVKAKGGADSQRHAHAFVDANQGKHMKEHRHNHDAAADAKQPGQDSCDDTGDQQGARKQEQFAELQPHKFHYAISNVTRA